MKCQLSIAGTIAAKSGFQTKQLSSAKYSLGRVFIFNAIMQQISLFDNPSKPQIELKELFESYFSCRKNKRNTANALAFELDYESNLIQLCKEINSGTYKIGRSIAFIVNKPIKREIFAASIKKFFLINC